MLKTLVRIGSVDADFQYAGMYMHSRSGSYLTPARAYNAQIATWLSRDPQDGLSYNYGNGNPVSFVDPLGLDSVSIVGRYDVPGHIGLLIQIGEGKTASYTQFDGVYTGYKIGTTTIRFYGTLISKRRQMCKKPTDVPMIYENLTTDKATVRNVLDIAESVHRMINARKLPYTVIPPFATIVYGIPAFPFFSGGGYTSNQEAGTILRFAGLNVPPSVFAPGANLDLPFLPEP